MKQHQSNSIGNEGAKSLEEALKTNKTLTSLKLGGKSFVFPLNA